MRTVDPLIGQLREYRHQAELYPNTLAARAGIAHAQIYRAEAGEVSPTLCTLRAWAEALDCDIQLVPRSTISAEERAA